MSRPSSPDRRAPRRFRTAHPDQPTPPPDPRAHITIPASVILDGRLQPQDLAVLLYLWLRPPGSALTHAALVTELKTLGWRSANGQPIGRDATYTTLTNLIRANYLTRHQDRGPDGCLGPAIFTLYNEPAPAPDSAPIPTPAKAGPGTTPPADPAPPPTASPQVTTAFANAANAPSPPEPPTPGKVNTHPPTAPRSRTDTTGAPARRRNRQPRPPRPRTRRTATRPAPHDVPPLTPEHHSAASRALTALARHRPDLHLGTADLDTLTPLAAQWFARGATTAQLTAALTTGLPDQLTHPRGILRHRLTHKMPPPPTPRTVPPPRPRAVDEDGTGYTARMAEREAVFAMTEDVRAAAVAQMRAGLRAARAGR